MIQQALLHFASDQKGERKQGLAGDGALRNIKTGARAEARTKKKKRGPWLNRTAKERVTSDSPSRWPLPKIKGNPWDRGWRSMESLEIAKLYPFWGQYQRRGKVEQTRGFQDLRNGLTRIRRGRRGKKKNEKGLWQRKRETREKGVDLEGDSYVGRTLGYEASDDVVGRV